MRPGLGALYIPGRRCPPERREATARRLPRSSGLPCTPLPLPTGGAFSHETSSRVHGCSPVRSSPRLLPSGGTRALGLLPGASHSAVTSDACPGGDRSTDTDPGLLCCRRHRRPPLQGSPLNTRDLVSHLHLGSASDGGRNKDLDNPHSCWSEALFAYLTTRRTARFSRVAGTHCCVPAPSEPCLRLPAHTAQAGLWPLSSVPFFRSPACNCRWHRVCTTSRLSRWSLPPRLRYCRWCT